MPPSQIDVATRMGMVHLRPDMIASIDFDSPAASANQIDLIDGSHFSGIVTADCLEFRSSFLGSSRPLRFGIGSLARLQFVRQVEGSDSSRPTARPASADESELADITLRGGESLVGSPEGRVCLETAFDTIQIDAAEIAAMQRVSDESDEVQLTLSDGAVAGGRIQSEVMSVRLQCGLSLTVPMSMIEEYFQPFPQSTPKVLTQVKELVTELCSSDGLRSDRAAEALKKMGPPIMGAMKSVRAGQSPIAQSRINEILSVFQSERNPSQTPAAALPPDDGQAANVPAER